MEVRNAVLSLEKLLPDGERELFYRLLRELCFSQLLHDAGNRLAVLDGRLMLLAKAPDPARRLPGFLPAMLENADRLRQAFYLLALLGQTVEGDGGRLDPRSLLVSTLGSRFSVWFNAPARIECSEQVLQLGGKHILELSGLFLHAGALARAERPVQLLGTATRWSVGPLPGMADRWAVWLQDDPDWQQSGEFFQLIPEQELP